MTEKVAWGVFSEDKSAEGEGETLYRITVHKDEALAWMGRYILYKTFGVLNQDAFDAMSRALHTMVMNEDHTKTISYLDDVYYIREISSDEIASIQATSVPGD